jgi:putative ABC transport system permease protein
VKHVVVTNMIPFGNSSWNTGISTRPQDPDSINAAFYLGSEEMIDTFGLQLVEGRAFEPGEYVDFDAVQKKTSSVGSVIITRELEQRLFPGGSAIGKTVYIVGDTPQTVVGVVERLARPNDFGHPDRVQLSMILPIRIAYTTGGRYVLRIDPSRREQVMAAIEPTLFGVSRARIILDRQPFSQVRAQRFKQDRAMVWLLVGVSITLLLITALGIVGLASFWVQQRTRQIGIRRALGATRTDILRYFQVENFILATLGIVLGMALAYALNLWLMSKYQVPRLPATFLPIGAILLWLLGQLAVLGPALRASTIAPAIATRTV